MKKTGFHKKKVAVEKPTESNHDFPIVAIGSSAGGLEAVSELFKNLSPHTGMAFLYVQHLSPDHKSMLSSLLAKTTPMKVQEAANKQKMLPNNVYVIPADKEMNIVDGLIKISPRPEIPKVNLPIDILFSSLAEMHKENVIGIILSGSATDGTRGMKAIKHQGGLTFAQDDTAKFTSMRKSAIAAGAVDFILSPKEIAREISRLSKHPFILSNGNKKEKEKEIDNSEPNLKIILNILYKAHGVDFSQYKMNTIKRRIMRRMLLHKIKSLKEYSKLLTENPDEPDILYQDLLINVTAFFRDSEAHHYLKNTLLPKLLKSKKSSEPLRIWVAACATGEEAYSIAIALLEIQSTKFTNIPVQIFATDLDAKAIIKARIGDYSKIELEEVSPKRIQRFYTKSLNGFRVAKQVRDMCVFAQHNILTDPPFAHVDFVSCCNLVIYFDTAAQKKAIATFHYSLNGNGFLMLGKSESIGQSTHFFSAFNKPNKIFLRKNHTSQTPLPVLTPRFARFTQSEALQVANGRKTVKNGSGNSTGLDKAIDAVMLSCYMPASIIINEQMEILQFRGAADKYISPGPGKATLNILKMTRPEIAFELRTAISRAVKSKQSVRKFGIELKLNDVLRSISIEVVPLKIEWDEPVLLILFSEQEQAETVLDKTAASKRNFAAKDRRIKKLEEQLDTARADTLAITQEQEAFNEELQSANEEVVSSNEELQTINEELETSKEEIESTNEELSTANQELQTRNELLNESYLYSETVLLTVPLPLLILDSSIRVKSANKAFYSKFKVTEEETEGYRIYDMGNRQWNIPKLGDLLENIIPQNTIFENFEVEHEFQTIGKKTMLLNARRIQLSGQQLILLAIADITVEKNIMQEKIDAEKRIAVAESEGRKKIEASEQRLKRMVNVDGIGVLTLEPSGAMVTVNDAFLKMVGYSRKEFEERSFSWQDFTPPEYMEASLQQVEDIKALGITRPYEKEYLRKDGSRTWLMFVSAGLADGSFVKYVVDINDAKNAEHALRMSRERLRVTMESAVDFVIITMDKGRLVEQWNTGAERILGFTAEEMKGKTADIIFTDEDRANGVPEQETQTALKEGYAEDEGWHQRKDGSRFFMSGIVRPIYDPELTGFVKVARDVTSQKDSEDQLRVMEERNRIALQSAEMASWDWNVNDDKVTWNEQHYILFGTEVDQDTKTAAYFLEFVHPADKNKIQKALRGAVEESGIYKAEFRIKRKDNNEIRWMNGFGRAIEWNGQKVARMVGVMYDITERKNLEQQKEDFLNIASHELRTPVTSIKVYGEILEQTFEETEHPESVSLIHKLNTQVNRLNNLISDLLDTTKITEGQLPLFYEDFNIGHLLTQLVEEFQQLSKNHRLTLICDSNIDVHADKKRIEQVIINLVSNAIKYSPSGGQVNILCEYADEQIKVSVTDHGIGIHEEMQDKLFDRFFRVRSGISNILPGMGLGLYITSGIIKRHGGTLGVKSEPGKGSVFYFTLPRTN